MSTVTYPNDGLPLDHHMKLGTVKFSTGAVRSADRAKQRYDLISPIGLRRLAETCHEGAAKYSDYNWEKGMPISEMLNHGIAHIYAYLSGDRSEDHLAHAAWNMFGAMHSEEKWPQLNTQLRGPDCTPPKEDKLMQHFFPGPTPSYDVVPLRCSHCRHCWTSDGRNQIVCCPKCGTPNDTKVQRRSMEDVAINGNDIVVSPGEKAFFEDMQKMMEGKGLEVKLPDTGLMGKCGKLIPQEEFKECATCAAKPGSPQLCESCLHNRKLIDRLKEITRA